MKLMTTAAAAALTISLLGFAGAAQAQEYGNLALFGAAPPAPYFGGRFSNGPVWVEQLGWGPLGGFGDITGSVDWAFGGAWTSTNPNPPPMTTQVAGYIGSGGTFGSGDVVTLWGGANNIFNTLAPASVSANPFLYMGAVGTAAANDIGSLTDQVADAGAGTILVGNLPQLSVTPQFIGSPAGPLADAGVNAFNTQLRTNLFAQAAAHPDQNIILMDVYSAGQVVIADPGRFGFTNVTQTCFTGLSVCATPDTYFYWDGVHPTAAGHAFIAALASDYLFYADRSAPTAAQGETALRHRAQAQDAVFSRLGHTELGVGETGVSIILDGEEATVDARGVMPEVEDKSQSFRVALDHIATDDLRVGGLFSITQSEVDAGLIDFDSQSVSLDGYVGWRSGSMFVNGLFGVSLDNYRDIMRITAVPTVVNDSSTEGVTWSAKLQGGWVFETGSMTISPRAAIGYVNADVNGYTEDGEMVRHVISDRAIEAVTAEASIRLESPMGERVRFHIEGGYRDNLDYNADEVTASLADNPALPLSTFVDAADGGVALLDAGLEARLGENYTLGVAYRGRMGDELESHMGRVSLNLRF